MKKDDSYAISDIKTVVPVTQPTWVRLITVYRSDDTDDYEGGWDDRVLPVIAFGVATSERLPFESSGVCFALDDDGPCWLDTRHSSSTMIVFSLGARPARGAPVPGFTDGCKHEDINDLLTDFNWIYK